MLWRNLGGIALSVLVSGCSLLFAIDVPMSEVADAAIADAAVVAADASIPGMPFPPNLQVNLVDGVVGDINGDGIEDLVLASAPIAGGMDGVYVLLGPQTGPDLVYHYFVPSAVPPTAIAIGSGALGSDTGVSTLLVAGLATVGGSIEAFVYGSSPPGFGPPLLQTTTTGSDPSDIVVGDFDQNAIAGDVMVSAFESMSKFLRWLADESEPPYATGETFGELILALGVIPGALDDELIIAMAKPKILWRYYGAGPLSAGTSIVGACGLLSFARAARNISPTDAYVDVVAVSANKLCAYRLESDLGVRAVKEFHLDFVDATSNELPTPAEGFDDLLAVNLGSGAEPEIVLLDTHNTLPTTVYLVRDGVAVADGLPGSLVPTAVTSIELRAQLSPAFLLAADFDDDGSTEIWALDQRARQAACLRMTGSDLQLCR